ALVQAGWTVTASWPIETERGARMRAKNSAVLASSVFLVCRPRPEGAGVGEWRDVLAEMNHKVAAWLPRLEREGIHGADAIFACIGPALEVYSRYERVETASGESIPLGGTESRGTSRRSYLSYVWEAVAREALKMIFPEADPAGFEEDARVTALWLWTLRTRTSLPTKEAEEDKERESENGDEETQKEEKKRRWTLPYDDARLLIQALGANETWLKRPGGIIEVKGNTARLLPVAERRRYLLGRQMKTKAVRREKPKTLFDEEEINEDVEIEAITFEPGKTLLDRLHQAMILFADGRSTLLRTFLVEMGYGKDPRFWRLADALSRLYPRASQEKRWVDGVIARKRALGL
ncbi:MAG: hypothetical protein QXI12_09535, partial [Candidatus Methanomethyliaceae archaeon]